MPAEITVQAILMPWGVPPAQPPLYCCTTSKSPPLVSVSSGTPPSPFPVTGRDTSAVFQPTVPQAFCQRGHSLRAGCSAGHQESSGTGFEETLSYFGHQPCCLKSCMSLQGSGSTAANCSYHPPLLLSLETLLLEHKNTAYIF